MHVTTTNRFISPDPCSLHLITKGLARLYYFASLDHQSLDILAVMFRLDDGVILVFIIKMHHFNVAHGVTLMEDLQRCSW